MSLHPNSYDSATSSRIPESWRQELDRLLPTGDTLLACFLTNLDANGRYESGFLALTQSALWSRTENERAWQGWTVADCSELVPSEHAGVVRLTLFEAGLPIASWRYTLACAPRASPLLRAFQQRVVRRGTHDAGDSSESGVFVGDGLPAYSLTQSGAAASSRSGAATPALSGAGSDDDAIDSDSHESKPVSTSTLFRLWRFARPYRGRLLAGFLLTLASTAATLVPPYMTMPLMDKVLIPYQNGVPIDVGLVQLYFGGLLGAALLAWGLGWARTYILALVSERIGADLRTTTYEHLLKLSLEYFGGKRTGDLMARIGSETDRINVFLSLHLLDFLTDVLMIAMTAAILVSINPWLALVTLVPLPFIAWLIHLVRDRLRHGFEKVDRIWSEVTSVLADTIPGIRVVKAFAQESREAARFRQANRHNLVVNDRVNRVWSLFTPTVTLMTEIGLLIVWGFGIWLISRDQISVGVLTAFLAYISRFYTRLDSMSRIVSVTQKAAAGAKRIFDILDHVSSVPEPARPISIGRVSGRIEVIGAGFRYGNRPVVRNLSLTIEPGEMIGLVGRSGSGKSTLVNLICRFYDVSDGSIRIDGHDIRTLAIADFRSNIGLVLQEPFLFFGTIAENIAYGKPTATRAEIVSAARAAHAHEFILRLPHGYDSLVGERGQALSGGERQRISIARALLIDPRVLILDEATSAVDTTTEKEIQKALDNLVQGRTTIAIAHRLSTLRKADRLVVLDRGEVVEVGPHDELMAKEGHYHALYTAQQRLAADDAGEVAIAASLSPGSHVEKGDTR